MSFKAFVWAWDQQLAKDEHLIVLLALADISNDAGLVRASQPYIAKKARKTERTVRRALVAMEGSVITTIERPGRVDLITLNIPDEFMVRFGKDQEHESGKRGRRRKTPDISAANPGHESRITPDTMSDEPIREPKKEPEAIASSARGSRLPDDWEPDFACATLIGLSHAETVIQGERFRDYWAGIPGAKGRKLDWPATWRNWCRTASERTSNGRGSPASPSIGADRGLDRNNSRVEAMQRGAMEAVSRSGRRRWGL